MNWFWFNFWFHFLKFKWFDLILGLENLKFVKIKPKPIHRNRTQCFIFYIRFSFTATLFYNLQGYVSALVLQYNSYFAFCFVLLVR